ncbi:phage T7 F exclusion suppressor FxsA [Halorubrum distributum JCM 9100]|uniref:Phage T7 F exclusion suppressor FxsA n=5 Tax=Halorubrum distributum TaxID=29283 RepID=M0EYD4_9EURY|nr:MULTISPECIES: FxsA family protein [Halorubrum distributum group]OYR83249.1 membrane protein FxsA [Halorubrum distributum]ELZ35203.1 phage T7 F exclusion suppressor FxsA [Halorubrum terrestre JCM 10247]ELZ51897.1 phage T7 F exclusion suppressor FxsA [Halorubrum distributum JCM 9100]ELZ54616.1 phage T7 F exclusion suppressor FxsA [Halorubrum distributum JCM 10118]EMA72472.1 phage T7 F exclusion suppressor FxsA [Halorubrum arcis JCM 13916]
MRPRTLLALLLVVPLVDALFLIVVATRLGWPATVALVVLTAVLGMLLLRAEGRATLARIQRKVARGAPPTDELLDGGLLIAAGAFLLTPGLVTDAVGFLLALPLSRVPIRVALKKYVVVPYIERETDGFFSGNVYIGGFPDDGEGDFTMGGGGFSGGGPGGASGSGPDGFDGGNGADPDGSAGGNADAGGASADDDVVDVDFTVEEEERKGTD